MNEDFIPSELSKKLKEKGFNWKTIESYTDKIKQKHLVSIDSDIAVVEVKDIVNTYPKPTISQVLKWLREEKKIHIEIFLYDGKYSYSVNSITQICEDDLFHECLNEDTINEEYVTYEAAALEGIKYTINNLI